jgi:hypothetical protein
MATITNFDITSIPEQSTSGPLSSLQFNPYQVQILKYPQDLGANPARIHYVKFQINLLETSKYSAIPSGSNVNTTEKFFTFGPVLPNVKFQITPPRKTLATEISLYTPDTIQANYTNSYQEDNLNDYSIPKYGQLAAGLVDADGNLKKDVSINPLSMSPEILAALRDNLSGSVPVDILLKGKGFAVNPQVQLLFKATALRSFQMSFLFTPYSQDEAKSVANIIKQFKFHAAPEIGGGATSQGGAFFIPPSTFDISFWHGSQQNTSIHRIGESVLESIDVDYATNGWVTFPDGSPVQTRLTLNFKELDVIDKEKIQQGY